MDIDRLIEGIVEDVHRMDGAADENEYELWRMQLEFNIKNYRGQTLVNA